MDEYELIRPMSEFVRDHVGMKEDDEVVVLTDPDKYSIAKTLALASNATGASVVLQVMEKTKNHNAEPPDTVAVSLKEADIGFYITTHSITHTDAYRNARESGTLLKGMRGVTKDMFLEGAITTDFEELEELNEVLKSRLTDAATVRVTSEKGTDISFDVSGRPAFKLGYLFHDLNERNVGSFPDTGEVAIAPLENSATGVIVIDHAMDNIGSINTPVELHYNEGELVTIDGDVEAKQLQRIITDADENSGNLGEFAIGTNKDARLSSTVGEAKDRLGTVHFAVGDNGTLAGNVTSDIHLDGIVLWPTIFIDGEKIMEEGDLHLDY